MWGYYRPQTKFAKVMFSQVSVCPQGGGLSLCLGSLRPRWRGLCPEDLCPGGSLLGGGSVQRVLCPGGLCPGGSVQEGLCRGGGRSVKGEISV